MKMLVPSTLMVFQWCTLLTAGCATLQPAAQQHGSCYGEGGQLRDTLFVGAQLSAADPPVPRRQHLAPYPPAAGGEFTIRYAGTIYYAWGMPVRVVAERSDSLRLIRAGATGAISLYVLEYDLIEGLQHTLWAPITEDCVFLPFKHHSEMR